LSAAETPKHPGNSNTSPAAESIRALRDLIRTLRGEDGCPWDRKQTPESVITYLLEEAYELASAIDTGELGAIGEELGDVLFQVLFMAQLYEERGDLDLAGIAARNRTKMIRRHPHIFGEERLDTAGAVKQRWSEIKAAEKKAAGSSDAPDSLDLPAKLPALLKACRYFDRLPQKPHPREPLYQAIEALKAAAATLPAADGDSATMVDDGAAAQAAGDALLQIVQAILRMNRHPETLLNQAFIRRLAKDQEARG
jgi:tetrapyrrole methylase family protein/MazG family protein